MWNGGTLVELKWHTFGLFKTLQWLPVALRINHKLLPSPARPIPASLLPACTDLSKHIWFYSTQTLSFPLGGNTGKPPVFLGGGSEG